MPHMWCGGSWWSDEHHLTDDCLWWQLLCVAELLFSISMLFSSVFVMSTFAIEVQSDTRARLDTRFNVRFAPKTPFYVSRPLVQLNRDSKKQNDQSSDAHNSRYRDTNATDGNGGGQQVTVTADGRIGVGTDSPTTALDVNGGIKSSSFIRSNLWSVNKVLPYAPGTLPRSASFTSHGGTLMLQVSAQAIRASATASTVLSVDVVLDGTIVESLRTVVRGGDNANVGVNVALPSDTIVLEGVAKGQHTVLLRVAVDEFGEPTGTTDQHSVSSIAVTELPW